MMLNQRQKRRKRPHLRFDRPMSSKNHLAKLKSSVYAAGRERSEGDAYLLNNPELRVLVACHLTCRPLIRTVSVNPSSVFGVSQFLQRLTHGILKTPIKGRREVLVRTEIRELARLDDRFGITSLSSSSDQTGGYAGREGTTGSRTTYSTRRCQYHRARKETARLVRT